MLYSRLIYVKSGLKLKSYIFPYTIYFCVVYGSCNKHRLFQYTTLIDNLKFIGPCVIVIAED